MPDILPTFTKEQTAFIEALKQQTGISKIVTRLEQPSGTENLIFVLPTPTEQNAFADDGLDEFPLFPEWYDLSITILTATMLPAEEYFIKGYIYSNLQRKFAGSKIAIAYDVQFDKEAE